MFVQRAKLQQAAKILHNEGRASRLLWQQSAVLAKSSEVRMMAMECRACSAQ